MTTNSRVFSGLSPLVMEEVRDEDEQIRVCARTPDGSATCPDCGAETAGVHGYHQRYVADVPIDGCRALVVVRMCRLQSRATCATGLPVSFTIRTAPARNSGSKRRRVTAATTKPLPVRSPRYEGVRHEVLFDRAEMKGLRLLSVVAGG